MKKICMFISVSLLAVTTFSQATEGTVQYQNSQQPAAVIELPYSPDVVKAAMSDYLSKKGRVKGKDTKGFATYRNTEALQTDSSQADLSFQVERKSRQEREVSLVSLLLTTAPEGAPQNVRYLQMEEAKTILNELAPAIEAYQLERQIKAQNETLIRAESKYKDLADDGADLEKKQTAIGKKLSDNRQEVKKQMEDVGVQKQKLSLLVSQRKTK